MNKKIKASGVLTVEALRKALHGLHPKEQVVIATDDWYVNVAEVARPDDDVHAAVTLYPGKPASSTQF